MPRPTVHRPTTVAEARALVLLALSLAAAPGCVVVPATGTSSAGSPGAGNLEAERRLQSVERVDLLGPRGLAAFKLEGETKKVTLTTVPVSGQPFGSALRAAITEGSGSEWNVQLVAPNAQPIEKGDVILATFHLRAPAPPEGAPLGQTEFVFELGRAPYSKSANYPVQVGGDWTKVHVRFTAGQAFATGEAHVIFRLGYDPETIELGGATVANFGKRVPLTALPYTQAADRERERTAAATVEAAEEAAAKAAGTEGGELMVAVEPAKVIRPINPYVYGINAHRAEDSGATLRRLGGNRASGYNWENNASNAGNDYHHNSDEWSCTVLGYRDCDVPAAQVVNFAAANRKDDLATIITVPMLDYVTADKKGQVKEADAAPSGRWVKSLAKKPGALATTPDLDDGVVYQDELVSQLVAKVGKAADGGVRFYSLDNEPALWPSTHPRIHPGRTTYAEMAARTEATAAAITSVDPGAVVLGGVMFGWSEFISLNEAPDFQAENTKLGPGATYLDFLLSQLKRMEGVHKRRLVHALDVHWYPEARGRRRITENDVSRKTVAARLQAARSLWDPTYLEKSWIAASWGKPIRLIPWLRERIAERYPGTKLAITEYDFGAGNHVSGGLAQADALGVFGREGVDLANYWGSGAAVGKLPPYVKAAFQLYRNYDGKGGTFGDTAVAVSMTGDPARASVFASTDSKRGGALTVVVINKDQNAAYDGKIAVGTGTACPSARVFVLQSPGAAVKELQPVTVANGTITHRLPPLSATLFACGK